MLIIYFSLLCFFFLQLFLFTSFVLFKLFFKILCLFSFQEANTLARPAFIVDNIDDDTIEEAAEESDEDDVLFDSVCAFCDNGGKLLWYVFLSYKLICFLCTKH